MRAPAPLNRLRIHITERTCRAARGHVGTAHSLFRYGRLLGNGNSLGSALLKHKVGRAVLGLHLDIIVLYIRKVSVVLSEREAGIGSLHARPTAWRTLGA